MVSASIITIGDELLIGQVIDTNSAYIAQELNKAGIAVKRRVAVGDTAEGITNALDEESKHAEIILITGGLGPTSDDITKPLLCKYFNGKMVVNESALQNVKYLFNKVFKRETTEVNLKQAEVPDVCTVIQNKKGTAPGMWFEKDEKIFVSMPGVPNEMQGMIKEIIEKLKSKFELPVIIHKTLLTAGIGESMLAEVIKDFETYLPPHIKLAYLPNYGMVRLRLTTSGYEKDAIENEINSQFATLKNLTKEYLVADEDEPLEKVIGKILSARNETMGTAESCTGGYIAHLITSHPGSSKFFKGCVVSYDNDVKENVLHVSSETLKDHGAVSEETVKEMLKGALDILKTDYAIAVSGIMGPDGGTSEKPVGTVWIAVGSFDKLRMTTKSQTLKLNLRFDRMRNIQVTAQNALNLLRK
ncbi:MAG: CinA family nicotinamide mononucleotide deamidase-related protein, partial [Bacteroidota bacterium]|nr:CinA family nicotinamide mononucleotide deamidase-related protein [Bacteroidota bacterium]